MNAQNTFAKRKNIIKIFLPNFQIFKEEKPLVFSLGACYYKNPVRGKKSYAKKLLT